MRTLDCECMVREGTLDADNTEISNLGITNVSVQPMHLRQGHGRGVRSWAAGQ